VWWPIAKIDTRIHYINNVSNTLSIACYLFKMVPRIWSGFRIDKLLYLLIALLILVLENRGHSAH